MGAAVRGEFAAKRGPSRAGDFGGGKDKPWRCPMKDGEKAAKICLSDVDLARMKFRLEGLEETSLGRERGAHNGEVVRVRDP